MDIAFYPSFRALNHDRASGLVSIARDVHEAMQAEGHRITIPMTQSMEWIYLRPGAWPATLAELWQADRALRQNRPHCWLTYHSYYRGPDVVGPVLSGRHNLPYFILAASYATKYRKRLKTWLGYQLNRRALQRADMIFLNKRRDVDNLRRLLPPERITYIRPGIRTRAFPFNPELGLAMRARLGLQDRQVVVTAAMMRPGVKEDGIAFVIEACATLSATVKGLHLLIIGDGPGRARLADLAHRLLPGAHSFVGRIAADEMHAYYQAGDLFAFPGINESLGMVYLEAQCCGLPVVATSHDGAPEVVADQETGLIVPPFAIADFAGAIFTLLTDAVLRRRFSQEARQHVLSHHDTATIYRAMFQVMEQVCAGRRS